MKRIISVYVLNMHNFFRCSNFRALKSAYARRTKARKFGFMIQYLKVGGLGAGGILRSRQTYLMRCNIQKQRLHTRLISVYLGGNTNMLYYQHKLIPDTLLSAYGFNTFSKYAMRGCYFSIIIHFGENRSLTIKQTRFTALPRSLYK